jgi:hypothetical protein
VEPTHFLKESFFIVEAQNMIQMWPINCMSQFSYGEDSGLLERCSVSFGASFGRSEG